MVCFLIAEHNVEQGTQYDLFKTIHELRAGGVERRGAGVQGRGQLPHVTVTCVFPSTAG